MDRLKLMSCDDLSEYLEVQGAHEDILRALVNNRINGPAFLSLTEDDLKELLPMIGDRIYIREILRKAREADSMVHSFVVCEIYIMLVNAFA